MRERSLRMQSEDLNYTPIPLNAEHFHRGSNLVFPANISRPTHSGIWLVLSLGSTSWYSVNYKHKYTLWTFLCQFCLIWLHISCDSRRPLCLCTPSYFWGSLESVCSMPEHIFNILLWLPLFQSLMSGCTFSGSSLNGAEIMIETLFSSGS